MRCVPKGNRGVRRIDAIGEVAIEIPSYETPNTGESTGLVVVTIIILGVALDDLSGAGVADDPLLIPLLKLWWDCAMTVSG